MHLTQALLKWPKSRPTGYIWSGKHRMVLKVKPHHRRQMMQDIERERANIFYCFHPAVTIAQEEAFFEKLQAEGPRVDQLWFNLRKAYVESKIMPPKPMSSQFGRLASIGGWEK